MVNASNNRRSVSVIIPTHNRKEWLPFAIESVLNQTCPPVEVILVDDGSTDGTDVMIRERYPEVRYFWQPRRGPAAARNRGAALARGEWLAFLDSDDRWLPQKLERQMAFLQQHPEYEAVHTDEIWIRRGRRVNPKKKHRKYGGWIYPRCLPLCIISPSSILLSRRLWDELGGFDESLPACEDYDLWLRMTASHPVGYLDEPLIVKYGGHDDQLSRQWGLDRYRVRALEKMLQQPGLPVDWYEQTREELLKKCRILVRGFEKHDRHQEAEAFRHLLQKWSGASFSPTNHHRHPARTSPHKDLTGSIKR